MAFIDTVRDKWEGISPRERAMLVLLAVVTPIVLGLVAAGSISKGLAAREAANTKSRRALAALADLLARRAAAATGAQRLDAVWRAVAAEPARPWPLTALARLAGVGPERLRRLCHDQIGVPPLVQVARLRMRQAGLLLAAGRCSVAEAASAVGYANPFAFSTAFRRHHGCPPSRWGR